MLQSLGRCDALARAYLCHLADDVLELATLDTFRLEHPVSEWQRRVVLARQTQLDAADRLHVRAGVANKRGQASYTFYVGKVGELLLEGVG